jgi:hypothetical protein
MRISVKMLNIFFTIAFITSISIIDNTVKANNKKIITPGGKKIVACNVQEGGVVVFIGSHCLAGTQQCVENPCN